MWIANGWKDYEVLDCSGGEKLERWKDYVLIRPDPQVIWNTPKRQAGWKKPNAHYHRSERGGGQWQFFDLPEQWSVDYACASGHKLTFQLKPFSFKHTGLFPEQAVNWDWFAGLIKEETLRRGLSPEAIWKGQFSGNDNAPHPVKILNLFAYTGGATLAAASAGAQVTHVDASKGMVTWARENAKSSGLEQAPIRWIVDDCMKFVEREARRGNVYDGIIMDPPSYGRGPKGEIWKIEDAIHPLVKACADILAPNPLFFLINSYTTGLQPAVLSYLLNTEMTGKGTGHVTAEEIGLPVRSSGLVLPCGCSARWEKQR
jgi:23S rRNA (cytosine1962-C5)-methyltransferase